MKYITIYRTLVSSWAFARLSTAMAKNTLRRVSGYLCSQENTKGLINTESVFTGPANLQINNKTYKAAWCQQRESILIYEAGYNFQRE